MPPKGSPKSPKSAEGGRRKVVNLKLTKAQTRTLVNKGEVLISNGSLVNIHVYLKKDKEGKEVPVARILNPFDKVVPADISQAGKDYVIHVKFDNQIPWLNIALEDTEFDITVNDKLDPFEDLKDATKTYYRLMKKTKYLTSIGKKNQFYYIALVEIDVDGNRKTIKRWDSIHGETKDGND